MAKNEMKKIAMTLGLFLTIIGTVALITTWYLHESEFKNYNAEPGYNILNNDECRDGDIVYIEGKKMDSVEYSDGRFFLTIDTMYRVHAVDEFGKVNITYIPISFDKAVDDSGGPDVVIKGKVIGEKENKSIEGLELYASHKILYRFFMNIEIISLTIGLMLYIPSSYQHYRKI